MKTIFYIEPEGTVLAVFPTQQYKPDYDATVTCYSSIGQHSGCCIEYLKECKIAIESEYRELLNELKSIGYSLEILNFSLENPLNP